MKLRILYTATILLWAALAHSQTITSLGNNSGVIPANNSHETAAAALLNDVFTPELRSSFGIFSGSLYPLANSYQPGFQQEVIESMVAQAASEKPYYLVFVWHSENFNLASDVDVFLKLPEEGFFSCANLSALKRQAIEAKLKALAKSKLPSSATPGQYMYAEKAVIEALTKFSLDMKDCCQKSKRDEGVCSACLSEEEMDQYLLNEGFRKNSLIAMDMAGSKGTTQLNEKVVVIDKVGTNVSLGGRQIDWEASLATVSCSLTIQLVNPSALCEEEVATRISGEGAITIVRKADGTIWANDDDDVLRCLLDESEKVLIHEKAPAGKLVYVTDECRCYETPTGEPVSSKGLTQVYLALKGDPNYREGVLVGFVKEDGRLFQATREKACSICKDEGASAGNLPVFSGYMATDSLKAYFEATGKKEEYVSLLAGVSSFKPTPHTDCGECKKTRYYMDYDKDGFGNKKIHYDTLITDLSLGGVSSISIDSIDYVLDKSDCSDIYQDSTNACAMLRVIERQNMDTCIYRVGYFYDIRHRRGVSIFYQSQKLIIKGDTLSYYYIPNDTLLCDKPALVDSLIRAGGIHRDVEYLGYYRNRPPQAYFRGGWSLELDFLQFRNSSYYLPIHTYGTPAGAISEHQTNQLECTFSVLQELVGSRNILYYTSKYDTLKNNIMKTSGIQYSLAGLAPDSIPKYFKLLGGVNIRPTQKLIARQVACGLFAYNFWNTFFLPRYKYVFVIELRGVTIPGVTGGIGHSVIPIAFRRSGPKEIEFYVLNPDSGAPQWISSHDVNRIFEIY